MKIKWNKVTWYSKTLAIMIFVVAAFSFFLLGRIYGRYQMLTNCGIEASYP